MKISRRALGWVILVIGAGALFLLALDLLGLGPVSLLEAGLLAMTPLALAAVGECINEKSGLINIGMEGIFMLSAIAGVWVAEYFNNSVMGLVGGVLMGALVGFILGVLSVYGRADQVIAGMGVNIFALGFVPYLLNTLFGTPGLHVMSQGLKLQPLDIPIGSGEAFSVHLITLAAIVLAFVGYYLLNNTVYGFRVRAVGEKPDAADVAGVRIDWIRISTSVIGGAMAGLGGAFMPLAWFSAITKEMSAGRGFIALACVVFAGLNPLLALGAAFLFGFTDGLAVTVAITPGVKERIPFYFVNMLPYVVTLVVVALFVGRRHFPAASGRVYTRE